LGTFREDLFYHLNVIHIEVPALRQHPEDIPKLVTFFLKQFARTNVSLVRSISPDALGLLQAYSWPGNVSELANVIQRLVVTERQEIVRPQDLALPTKIRMPRAPNHPVPEHRRTIADTLFEKLIAERDSF